MPRVSMTRRLLRQSTNEVSTTRAMQRRPARAFLCLLAVLACGGGLPEPSHADVALARADDPGIALEDLQRGRAAYARRCGNCHALRSPADRAPPDWPAEVTRMQRAHAVHLTPEEEHDILIYLRAASARALQARPSH
jgi:mono/diheme cytochrome c family protein